MGESAGVAMPTSATNNEQNSRAHPHTSIVCSAMSVRKRTLRARPELPTISNPRTQVLAFITSIRSIHNSRDQVKGCVRSASAGPGGGAGCSKAELARLLYTPCEWSILCTNFGLRCGHGKSREASRETPTATGSHAQRGPTFSSSRPSGTAAAAAESAGLGGEALSRTPRARGSTAGEDTLAACRRST